MSATMGCTHARISLAALILILGFLITQPVYAESDTTLPEALVELLPSSQDISSNWTILTPAYWDSGLEGTIEGVQTSYYDNESSVMVYITRFETSADAEQWFDLANATFTETEEVILFSTASVCNNSLGFLMNETTSTGGRRAQIWGVKSDIFFIVDAEGATALGTQAVALYFASILANKIHPSMYPSVSDYVIYTILAVIAVVAIIVFFMIVKRGDRAKPQQPAAAPSPPSLERPPGSWTKRLNPFAYLSETDIRFYFLVVSGITVTAFWSFVFLLIFFQVWVYESEVTVFLRLLILVPVLFLNPLLVYWFYRRAPKKIIKQAKLREFNKEKFPDHFEYIERLYAQHLPPEKRPLLMYQPMDGSESAFTFGTMNRSYISMSGGLIAAFRKKIDDFRSIFLHEMGHIANQDVGKTYLVAATWRSLIITTAVTLSIILLQLLYEISSLLSAGYDWGYTASTLSSEGWPLVLGGFAAYFLIFLVTLYVLRNQIIRLREFYADAKVAEWEGSTERLSRTLEGFGSEQHSRLEILTKFHPTINERIQVLKSNLRLFSPSIWVAFAIGYFYSILELNLSMFKTMLFSWDLIVAGIVELNVEFRALISVIIFTLLMIAMSSSFHRSILKDIFAGSSRYFSASTALAVAKCSLAFSLGYLADSIMSWFAESGSIGIGSIIGDLPAYLEAWIWNAVYLASALIFLLIFASMLMRRSFSKGEANRNFLMITILASILYIFNRFVAQEILDNRLLLIVFFLIFSALTYAFIKVEDRRAYCPNCSQRITVSKGLEPNCANCHHDLFSWAVYPPEERPAG